MTSKIVSPAGSDGNFPDQIQFVSGEDVGITARIAAAARLPPRG